MISHNASAANFTIIMLGANHQHPTAGTRSLCRLSTFKLSLVDVCMPILVTYVCALREHIHFLFLLVPLAESEPEANSTDERDDGNTAVEPDEQRILAEGREGLANGGRNSARKVVEP